MGSFAIFSVINIVDRRLFSRHFPSLPAFYIWETILFTLSGLVVLEMVGMPSSGEGILLGYLSGFVRGIGLMCVFLDFRV